MTSRRLYIEAPMNPGANPRDAAQFLMAEMDRTAAKAGRVVNGPVTILEGSDAFQRTLRLEADTKPA